VTSLFAFLFHVSFIFHIPHELLGFDVVLALSLAVHVLVALI
jgi:hypothetical protein